LLVGNVYGKGNGLSSRTRRSRLPDGSRAANAPPKLHPRLLKERVDIQSDLGHFEALA